jgi:hypothetical protein
VNVVEAKPSFPLEHAEALSQCQIASLRRPKPDKFFLVERVSCLSGDLLVENDNAAGSAIDDNVAIDFAICIENEQVDFRPDLEYAGLRG